MGAATWVRDEHETVLDLLRGRLESDPDAEYLDVCGTNPLVVMTAICLVGTFITEFISNTAAGAMFFPIMYEAAEKLGYEPFPFLVALMVSVSSSFATPIGSPTHMLVYGPGGYRFSDFMRIGLLMNIIILAANILIVNIIYPLTPLP